LRDLSISERGKIEARILQVPICEELLVLDWGKRSNMVKAENCCEKHKETTEAAICYGIL
jgi:hypothetical protein